MRTITPASRIRLLRIIAFMLSLPVFLFMSVPRKEIGWSVRLFFLWPTDAASPEAVVGLAQRIVVAHARTPRDEAVQYCLEYPGSLNEVQSDEEGHRGHQGVATV